MMENAAGKPRVLVADDNVQILKAVSRLLSVEFEVVGSVLNGEQAVDAALRLKPDVLILDIMMPVMDGVEAARCLEQTGLDIKILFLTALEDPIYVEGALERNVSGLVYKSQVAADLPFAIRAVLSGRTFCSTRRRI
jgi:DNA-binding NarL/FixJ family response regulator